MMNVEEQQTRSSNGKFKVLFNRIYSISLNLFLFFPQKFRKRIFRPFVSRITTNNEQQTSLLQEQNKKSEAPIRNEDFEV
jgi:hypothetical protein